MRRGSRETLRLLVGRAPDPSSKGVPRSAPSESFGPAALAAACVASVAGHAAQVSHEDPIPP